MQADATPVHELDPFSDETLTAPEAVQDAIRQTGPVVWLSRYGVWAMAGHGEVHAALNDWQTYSSASGAGLPNLKREKGWRSPSIILEVDPPDHTKTRLVLSRIMSPAALRTIRDAFQAEAEALVGRLIDMRRFDAATEIAQAYPLRVFPDALGLDGDGRENLLPIGDLNFNGFGPQNARFEASLAKAKPLLPWLAAKCGRGHLRAGSFGAQIYEAADRGDLTEDEAGLLMRTFLLAGIDTTVGGLGNAVHCLATHPGEWAKLTEGPALSRSAFEEALRFDSPVQIFFRTATRDTEVGTVLIHKDEKVLLMLGGANRDPARWERPGVFDIERKAAGHVAFGYGIHGCVGQMVARLEGELVLGEMAKRIRTLNLDGEPRRNLNNTLRSFASLPVVIEPK